jgi:hypothetical protein
MLGAALLPCPIATVAVRSAGAMSPPAKVPGCLVIRSVPTWTTIGDASTRHAVEQGEFGLLAERQHHRPRVQFRELAGGLREAGLVEPHLLDGELAGSRRAIVDSQIIRTPSSAASSTSTS